MCLELSFMSKCLPSAVVLLSLLSDCFLPNVSSCSFSTVSCHDDFFCNGEKRKKQVCPGGGCSCFAVINCLPFHCLPFLPKWWWKLLSKFFKDFAINMSLIITHDAPHCYLSFGKPILFVLSMSPIMMSSCGYCLVSGWGSGAVPAGNWWVSHACSLYPVFLYPVFLFLMLLARRHAEGKVTTIVLELINIWPLKDMVRVLSISKRSHTHAM